MVIGLLLSIMDRSFNDKRWISKSMQISGWSGFVVSVGYPEMPNASFTDVFFQNFSAMLSRKNVIHQRTTGGYRWIMQRGKSKWNNHEGHACKSLMKCKNVNYTSWWLLLKNYGGGGGPILCHLSGGSWLHVWVMRVCLSVCLSNF